MPAFFVVRRIGGYCTPTLSPSARPATREYIARQETHHQKHSFREELINFLKKAGITYEANDNQFDGLQAQAQFDRQQKMCINLCMGAKTLSVDEEAYLLLARVKRYTRESFSKVIKRAKWDEERSRCGDLLVRAAGRFLIDFQRERKLGGGRAHDFLEENRECLALLPIVAFGEFCESFESSDDPIFLSVVESFEILPLGQRVTEIYGNEVWRLRRAGKLIGATALGKPVPLVTRNLDHFVRIKGLQLRRY